MTILKENIPSPDPSLATNERLAVAMRQSREETRGWVDSLQILLEGKISSTSELLIEKIIGGVENIKTRLDGNDTALVAALQAQKEAAAKQTENFTAILDESKKGTVKQIDALSDKIDDLKERMSEAGGRSGGMGSLGSMIIAGLAALAAIVSVIIVLTKSEIITPQPQPSIQRQRL